MRNRILYILYLLVYPILASPQIDFNKNLEYGIHKIYPPISISKGNLYEAQTLNDLYVNFESDWIKTYLTVEIFTIQEGKEKKAIGKDGVLNQKQKDHMNKADYETDIQVNVQYIPKNGLKNNEPKWLKFAFRVNPENTAEFPTGQDQLNQYLKMKVVDKIPDTIFRQYQLAAVTFIINEKGEVNEPKIFWSSDDEKTDQLLLEAICSMPKWRPAAYANGVKVKEEFVLTVGDMESCVVNQLNIRQTLDKFMK